MYTFSTVVVGLNWVEDFRDRRVKIQLMYKYVYLKRRIGI